ncbi:MAG: gliding motility-associated C-terminal domain-containing protein [Bacteroidetes bacterium]|nr:gliding motility-associated C-terminal domain-containing protein [Bacteroidota bacterium]MBU1719162.1 gliding motility-associated C-terminal domain-containing protein [Bacteroidota bacterium]
MKRNQQISLPSIRKIIITAIFALGFTNIAFAQVITSPDPCEKGDVELHFDTPGKSNMFCPGYTGNEAYSLVIYNRWGIKVFETSNKADCWNGFGPSGKKNTPAKRCDDGSYYYAVTMGEKSCKGYITLISK